MSMVPRLLLLVPLALVVVILHGRERQSGEDSDVAKVDTPVSTVAAKSAAALRARGVAVPAEEAPESCPTPAPALDLAAVALRAEVDQLRVQLFEARRTRMQPTLQRRPLGSDARVWANEPKVAPSFGQLYRALYNTPYPGPEQSIYETYKNPHNKSADFNYPHSSVWQEGEKIMARVLEELKPKKLEFIVEAGSMVGMSAIKMAMEIDKHPDLQDVPILCIDPWSGDVNMWLNHVVWEVLDVRDGRPTTYDQFMVNVRESIRTKRIGPHHIMPFPVSSLVGVRWLQATGFTPTLVYLDSAHEIDETYMELCLYWEILPVGGILMGDDYGWEAVRIDVDRFVADRGLKLNMFGVFYNWWIKKEA